MLDDVEVNPFRPLPIIDDLISVSGARNFILRRQVTAPASAIQPRPLIGGTQEFAQDWVVTWHVSKHNWPQRDIACYSIIDLVVSGAGQLWLSDHLITAPEIMPPYVSNYLQIPDGGNHLLHGPTQLPIRAIDVPCLVAVGHGIQVYGHFLIEILFRILVGRRAFQLTGLKYNVLLDSQSPMWLLTILHDSLGIRKEQIEFFDPQTEQVRLRHALVPTRLLQDERFHPFANELLEELEQTLAIPKVKCPVSRAFIVRNQFHNPFAPHRVCTNESELVDIAISRYGFVPISTERLHWHEQISLFRDAEIVLGQAGSGLHNALFSKPMSRLASLGFMNLVQSQIGALRQQRNAFLMEGFRSKGEFAIELGIFEKFLDAVCADGT
jgi:capsular polysaccharide biosynthesis protein